MSSTNGSKAPIEKLPWDIWYVVLRELTGTNLAIDPCPYLFDRFPADICRVNRRFCEMFSPFLYMHYKFTGYLYQTALRYLFLRMMIVSQHLTADFSAGIRCHYPLNCL
ncbi:hypothetical protein BDV10DRAFT_187495 [Aspergillus recurvatus]